MGKVHSYADDCYIKFSLKLALVGILKVSAIQFSPHLKISPSPQLLSLPPCCSAPRLPMTLSPTLATGWPQPSLMECFLAMN